MGRLETVFNLVEAKYCNVKKQQEAIADRTVEVGFSEDNQTLRSNTEVGEKLKKEYLECAQTFAVYQKKLSSTNQSADNSKS